MSTLPYNPDSYNTPNVDVSPLSIKSYFPANSPKIGTWLELWFGSNSHLDVGYKSNDPATVAAQVATIKARGFDFVALNWYGPNVQPQHSSTLLWQAECERQNLPFIIGLDKGAFTYGTPKGMDPTTYGLSIMQFMATTFFTSPAYMKHTDGRIILDVWSVSAVAGLDLNKMFTSVPNVAVLYDKATGVSKPASSGCFGWVGVPDPGAYQADFLSSVTKAKAANPSLVIMPSLVKGFDDHGRRAGLDPTKSCWDQTVPYRLADEKQGQQFLDRVAALNAHMQAHPGVTDYILVATHNDYEEDTATERGIDSQLTASLSAASGVLTLSLNGPNGNLNTVDHVELYVNGSLVWSPQPAASLTFDLSSLNPIGVQAYSCYAVAVGKPLFQNKTSNTVSTTATVVPYQTKDVSVPVHVDTSVSIPVSGSANGLTVSGTFVYPVKQDSTVIVTATVTTQTIWS